MEFYARQQLTLPNEDDTASVSPIPTEQVDLSLTKSISPTIPGGRRMRFT